MLLGKLAILSFVATIITVAYAETSDPVSPMIQAELSKRFPGARIELLEDVHWTSSEPRGVIDSIHVGDENARAQVQFTVSSHDENAEEGERGTQHSFGYVSFAAYIPARVMVRRVLPGENLQADQFSLQEVNIASGPNHEFRGVILSQKTDIGHLEARQTLIEGQPLLSSAVQRTPDVRRGDSVRVRLVSNGLTLSTQGMASEPAYLNGPVRVLTTKTKRELSGKLVAAGTVEVKL